MKHHLCFVFIFFAAFGCSSSNDQVRAVNGSRTVVGLRNGLGVATIVVPAKYDTLIQWTSISDCHSCGFEKYRIQIKSNPIRLERGFIWNGDPIDSVDDITISHPIDIYPVDTNTQISLTDHKLIVHEYNMDPKYHPILNDTILKIGSRIYSISYSNNYDSSNCLFRKALISATRFRGEDIYIVFRSWSKKPVSEEYFNNCFDILRTVEFANGH